MISSKDIQNFFFLGIGGIGMSALARYFYRHGYAVCGYDRTPSALTKELEAEGIQVTYEDDPAVFSSLFSAISIKPDSTLIVRTPAVPEDSAIYTYLREHGYDIRKRAEVLGIVTQQKKALCVAGTHGKTTTSTMIAHLMNPVNAFLGGISMNYHTNMLMDKDSEYVVVEADEYDRSFHHLRPYISVVTAVDADHLDIYGTEEAYREAFAYYTELITGALVMKHGIALKPRLQPGVKCYQYGVLNDPYGEADRSTGGRLEMVNDLDFYAENIRVSEGRIVFDFHTPEGVISDIELGVPVWVNIENAVAAMSVAWLVERMKDEGRRTKVGNERMKDEGDRMREAMASFKGVQRRFNIHVNTPKVAYIDDYAHHPEEIATAIDSIRKVFPARRLIGVFQPHLYTRTRDFADGFRKVLATLDECILLPIYPAREKPIPGVTSEMLMERTKEENERMKVVQKNELVEELKRRVAASQEPVVVLTVGAGDIDRMVPAVAEGLEVDN